MLRETLALAIGVAWIGGTWYMVFTGGPNFGSYSLFLAPIVTGLIVGRTSAGAVVGFLPNFLLGVAVGVIILRDLSTVSPGSLESVFGLFGLLGAAILAVVGGIVGAVCGGIGGFVGSRFTRNPKGPVAQPPSRIQNGPVKACPRCLSTWAQEMKLCPSCGGNL